MKKLHSLALYALVTPVITFGAGSVLAQSSEGTDVDRVQQSNQRNQDATQSKPGARQGNQNTQRDQARMQYRGYMDSAPANGMQASNLIGAEVKTTNNEKVGSVSDLIIDDKGQIVGIVVGVGGFLGMGEKDVAIGWDDVTRSGSSDKDELKIKATREELMSAPEFKRAD